MTRDELLALRNHIYRRTRERRLHREADALRFINEVGFCFLFSSEGSEMPTLYEAILGQPSEWSAQHDRETGMAWRWKDSLPISRQCFYGKLLRGKPVLISLAMFPYFYAISGNYGDLEQYLEEYRDGKLSLAAKQVYESLFYHGALPTSDLRRKANLGGKGNARAFDRALVELQMGLKIAKTGISDANRWRYCYVYDLLPRWLPDQVQQGLAIKSRDAYPVILRQYLDNVIVARPEDIVRLFGWSSETVDRAIAALVDAGDAQTGVTVEGLEGTWLCRSQHKSP
jgi:hypothetical protein